MLPLTISAQKGETNVLTNRFADNWELSFGIEGMSFYSSAEKGMNLPKNPFMNFRTNFGASASIGKWFTPEIGLRTKFNGYWGKNPAAYPKNYKIHFFSLQEQVTFNANNLIYGYNPNRIWNLIPFCGVGFMRNATNNENSIGVGLGVSNTFRINKHIGVHADLGYNFGGQKYDDRGMANAMGRYHWFSAELGINLYLGKNSWTRYRNRRSEKVYVTPALITYDDIPENKNIIVDNQMVIANSNIPQDMVLVNRGHVRMGFEEKDTLWGLNAPSKGVSVDDFWMDKTEVTNKQYRAFIKDVCDSIIVSRLRNPAFGGDIDAVRASLYITNPVTGQKCIDSNQIFYAYETYDEQEAMKRKYRLDPRERILNTDIKEYDNEEIWISKDTAYIDSLGNIIRETITRPYTGAYDFLNTYIVNVFPDTTCWVNDFPYANNKLYAKYYFSHKNYEDYPVVGVTWEQANAYCAWRTEKMRDRLGSDYGEEQPFRLPTEAEWEYAARGRKQNTFPWPVENNGPGNGKFLANYMTDDGDYTDDGNIITSHVAIYPPNDNGLYDMAGNVAEWTSTHYTTAGVTEMNNINPELNYNAAIEDPYRLKLKCVKGGSWKDPESHIRSAWRTSEYQNQPRCYIGFRCVRSVAASPSEKSIVVLRKKK